MTASGAVTHTDSEKGAKHKVQLKIKFRIEKFEALMESTKPGEGELWSEGVSSELAPHAAWKLKVYPNGRKEEDNGNIGVYLHLAGLLRNLDATNHIYLVDGSGGGKIDVVELSTNNFGETGWGDCVGHDRVKKALQADGSMLVEADVEFPIPCDGKTESEEKSTLQIQRTKSGKKAVFKVEQTIKFRIEEFEALMESTKPGEGSLWSEGVTSKLSPRAVWKLNVYPNGWKEEYKGNVGVFLWLTGPMPHSLQKDNGETLYATYHLYLIDGSNGSKINVVGHCTRAFEKEHDGWGWNVDHERVKKALHADGSLLVAADVEFLVPCDGEVEDHKYDQLEQQKNELTKNNERLEDQLKTQKEESEELRMTADKLQKENYQLKIDAAMLRSARNSLQEENERLGTVRDEAVSERDDIKKQLDDAKEVAHKNAKALDEAVGERDGIKKQLGDAMEAAAKYAKALDETVDERDGIKKQLDDALKKLNETNEKYEAEVRDRLEAKEAADKQTKALIDEVAALKEKICKGCAPSGDETQKAPYVKPSSEPHSDQASSGPAIETEKHSICEALNVGNVIAMAMHADSNSLDTRSAQLLKESSVPFQACLELIAREWDAVYGSAKWKELERDLPKLAVDLAFGAATLSDAHTAEKFKEACLKLIANGGKTVNEEELKRTKPEFALDLAEGAAAVSAEKE